MVSVIGIDSEKVQQLCDAANQEVPEAEKVQIANYLCPVRFLWIWLLTSLDKILFLGFIMSNFFGIVISLAGKLCCLWRHKRNRNGGSQGKVFQGSNDSMNFAPKLLFPTPPFHKEIMPFPHGGRCA